MCQMSILHEWKVGRVIENSYTWEQKNVLYKESYLILHFVDDRVSRGSKIAAAATFITSKSWASGRLYNSIQQAVSFELLEISRWSQIFYIDVEVWSLTYRLAFGIFLFCFSLKKRCFHTKILSEEQKTSPYPKNRSVTFCVFLKCRPYWLCPLSTP